MATNVTDKLFEALPRQAGKVGAGGVISDSTTTIPHTFVGLTDGHCYIVTANRTNATGTVKNQLNETETFIGKVSSGNFIECVREVEGAAQAWAVDTVLEILLTSTIWNKLVEHILVQHGQDGVHTSSLVTSLKAIGAEINTGTDDAKIVTPKAIADSFLGGATSNIQTQINLKVQNDGWISANESWTYASATTITVPSGAAAKYAKGDKIKLTQTTVKYFYIVGVADTVLTITGGTSYTLTNAAITLNYYSHQSSPIGFPNGMAFTSTPSSAGGTTPTFTSKAGRFSINGNKCRFDFNVNNNSGGTAGVGANDFYLDLPVVASADMNSTTLGIAHYTAAANHEIMSVWINTSTTIGFRLSVIFSTLQNNLLVDPARYVQGFLEYYI